MARLKYHQRRRARDDESDDEQEVQEKAPESREEEKNEQEKEEDDGVMPSFGDDDGGAMPDLDGATDVGGTGDSAAVMPTLPKSTRPKFSIDDLVKAEGLEWVAKELPRMAKFEHKDPAADALRLIQGYRDWQQKLFPKLAFDEFLARVNRLGNQGRVRNFLETMREDQRWGRKRDRGYEEASAANKVILLQDDDKSTSAPTAKAVSVVDETTISKIEANRLAAIEKRRERLAAAAQARAAIPNKEEYVIRAQEEELMDTLTQTPEEEEDDSTHLLHPPQAALTSTSS